MAAPIIMPKATAVWLIDNTSLTFDQIAKLCNLHPLEVKAIADEETTQIIRGIDPIIGGQISREEIAKGEQQPDYNLQTLESNLYLPTKKQKVRRYTPLSKRHDRPNAILWLLRNYPDLKDAQIIRLLGTTKTTITQVRDRTHWNSTNLSAADPVTLGLCSQIDFDAEINKANALLSATQQKTRAALLPASFTERLEIEDDAASTSETDDK